MIFSWLDESGTVDCYQEKEGQSPVFILCSWLLDSKRIIQVAKVLAELENDFRKVTHITGEIKGADLIRPYKSEQKNPEHINTANSLLVNGIIKCLREHEAKIVARAFAKRLHAKYDPKNLYSFAHLVLFEQIYLWRNSLNYAELPISMIADTLPSKKVVQARQAITDSIRTIEKQAKSEFPLLWSFDLSSENVFIRVADILGRILFAIAHNRWSHEVGGEKLYPQVDTLWNSIGPLMFGMRCDEHLTPLHDETEKNLFRLRWFPSPYKDLK